MKTLRLFWGPWIIVTGPLKFLNWRSAPEKKTARLFKSDGPWRCLNWLVLQQENLLMLTAVLLWCHQLPFEWWKDSERRPAFGKEPLMYTSLQTRQGVRFIIVAIRFPISIKKTLPISGQGQQPVSPKLLLCFLCLLMTNIAGMFSYHYWQSSFPFVVLIFNVWTFLFLPDQLTRS